MKIVLDNIIFSLQKMGGISVYWFELIQYLINKRQDLFIIQCKNSNLLSEKIESDIIDDKYFLFPLILYRFLPAKTNHIKNKFIFHSSYYRITKNPNAISIVTIHDFIHEKYYKGIRKFIHVYQKKRAIKNAKGIIVISENTKKDLLNIYPNLCENKKIVTIYNGVSLSFSKLENVYNDQKSFLYVGSREKYKNFEFIVLAISNLKEFRLSIVGTSLSNYEILFLNKYLDNRWALFNNISSKALNILYNKSFSLLYPSSYEGFGIPLLESMKAGCPFIALNTSSITEVAGKAGFLMNELTYENFVQGVIYISKNREYIINEGFLQSSKFSWNNCFKETLAFYEEIYK